jgi:hypothetical protein
MQADRLLGPVVTDADGNSEDRSDTVWCSMARRPRFIQGTLKCFGGSPDHWNNVLANQTVQTLWTKHSDKETLDNPNAQLSN